MFPISVISHQTVIPPNSPDYIEHFDKIELPNREEYDLRITTVNVSVDTTGLYNITSDNTMIANIGTSHMEFIITILNNPMYTINSRKIVYRN